jgi:cell filamentation protein
VRGAAGDPYLDPASGVLRNLLGITDAAELARAEAALSASRLIDLERRRLPGRYDLAHLRARPADPQPDLLPPPTPAAAM